MGDMECLKKQESENVEERDILENQSVDGRIILKWDVRA
jgi:hypothetical protein